jgi:ketosteroid isomerase-like protein
MMSQSGTSKGLSTSHDNWVISSALEGRKVKSLASVGLVLVTQLVVGSTAFAEDSKKSVAASLPETGASSSIMSTSQCQINCIDPHPSCSESAKVIETVQLMYKAFSEKDLVTVGKYLDENCTTFDEATQKLIKGKTAVLEDMKLKLTQMEDEDSPLVSYTIDNPYAQVTGDTAVVSFTAIKKLGGKDPHTMESHCTDIFKKEGDKWLRMHYRSNWKVCRS